MQRLSDIWQNFFANATNNQIEAQDQSETIGLTTVERESHLEELFKNLYWTWLVSMQNNQDEPIEMWSLSKDVIDALNELDEIQLADPSSSMALFDPNLFQSEDPLPSKERYALDPRQI